jgi:hypothetical protein
MIKACEGALADLPPDVKVIPGHGDLSTVAEVREYVKMLKETSTVIGRAIHAGQTVDEMKKAKLLAPWSAKYSNDFVTADIFIETLYNSLTHQQHTPFVKHN